ncbi:aminoglycoside adenylyltransferase domain-containing protein [Luteococcus japonicus]|uniref:Nucleotidyltransferase domain protein n=1 Tax=Luteococcus japonicus LSP_Lj1 TaxID=1255658 RepID=A0A1R4IMM7_9ACTN|nr:aminoglycoside adenylyltransferase domain-containing protein [Luteococcus japonicus]SJN21092.1 Nucleotidyltransferase domain protein [Luteococcus japonicus LSP_Lj1]
MDDELPEVVRQICASFNHAIHNTSEDLLVGLYLRGSLCWGEFFPSSDVDFTAVLSRRPGVHDLQALESAHTQIWFEFPEHDFDGHHVVLEDLHHPPADCPHVPCAHAGTFTAAGLQDVNPVSWAELSQRGIRVTGRDPQRLGIAHDQDRLLAYSRKNLDRYWGRTAKELKLGWMLAGRRDDAIAWCTLGVARLHHLLATGELTSKSGAGRYILDELDERWHPLAAEALRIRERPDEPSTYRSHSQRGKDARDFVAWCVSSSPAPPSSSPEPVSPSPEPVEGTHG